MPCRGRAGRSPRSAAGIGVPRVTCRTLPRVRWQACTRVTSIDGSVECMECVHVLKCIRDCIVMDGKLHVRCGERQERDAIGRRVRGGAFGYLRVRSRRAQSSWYPQTAHDHSRPTPSSVTHLPFPPHIPHNPVLTGSVISPTKCTFSNPSPSTCRRQYVLSHPSGKISILICPPIANRRPQPANSDSRSWTSRRRTLWILSYSLNSRRSCKLFSPGNGRLGKRGQVH